MPDKHPDKDMFNLRRDQLASSWGNSPDRNTDNSQGIYTNKLRRISMILPPKDQWLTLTVRILRPAQISISLNFRDSRVRLERTLCYNQKKKELLTATKILKGKASFLSQEETGQPIIISQRERQSWCFLNKERSLTKEGRRTSCRMSRGNT